MWKLLQAFMSKRATRVRALCLFAIRLLTIRLLAIRFSTARLLTARSGAIRFIAPGRATPAAFELETARAEPDVMAADLDRELQRRPLFKLAFLPALEDRFEAETKAARAHAIRLTLAMGLVAYDVITLTDGAVLPDIGHLPVLWRLGVVTPVALVAMWTCARLPAWLREAYLALMMLGALIGPVCFMLFSHAELAPYTMLVTLLVGMFGNITIRLRFVWACRFSAFFIFSVGTALSLKRGLPDMLSLHLMICTIVCASFGLFANNQLERSERRSFLLSFREAMRARQLIADKENYSALSQIDGLTGLANRRAFDTRFDTLVHLFKDQGQPFALVMLDVDFFKRFNDHYGHPAGDDCLQRVAQLLRHAVVREGDLVARYGGEEFAVLLADCRSPSALLIAERLRMAVFQAAIAHHGRDDAQAVITVSIGVGTAEVGDIDSRSNTLSMADRHLYQAKRAGRNRVFPVVDPGSAA